LFHEAEIKETLPDACPRAIELLSFTAKQLGRYSVEAIAPFYSEDIPTGLPV
jgi:hypothetical protein